MTLQLTVKVDLDGRATTVAVAGTLDGTTANGCLKQLLKALHIATPSLVVDLAEVDAMDACGLGILLAARNQAAALGGSLLLTRVPNHLQGVLDQATTCERLLVTSTSPRHRRWPTSRMPA